MIAEIFKVKEVSPKLPTERADYYVVEPMAGVLTNLKKIQLSQSSMKGEAVSVALSSDLKNVASKDLVAFLEYDKLIDRAYNTITKTIQAIQEKYKNSPIYIDSFTVHLGIPFSVDINFKIK